jgi:hypothetical protein
MLPVNKQTRYIEFYFVTAVTVNISIFWNVTPCSALKVNWHFEGTYRLQAINQNEAGSKLAEDGGDVFLRNVGRLLP